MTKTPIQVIVAGMRRMPLQERIDYLRGLVKQEPLYSADRNELESLLRGQVSKQERRVHRAPEPASAPFGHQEAETVA